MSCDSIVDSYEPTSNSMTIPSFHIYITDERLESLYAQKMINYYVPAEFEFDKAQYIGEIRPQGSGSRYHPYWSYTVRIPSANESSLAQSFNLSAQPTDITLVRTVLMTHMCHKYGVKAPETGLVKLSLNGEFVQVYVKTDRIDEIYFMNNSLPVYELLKVSSGGAFTFTQKSDVMTSFEKQIPDDGNLNFLTEFIHVLDTVSTDGTMFLTLGEKYLDIPAYLKFHALHVIVNNLDGLTNNMYLYRSSAQEPYSIFTHDFDDTFYVTRKMDIESGNEIIEKLLKNDSCRMLYYQDVRDILDHVFTEEELFPIIDTYAPEILENNKANSSFNETAFMIAINELKKFISRRRNELFEFIHS